METIFKLVFGNLNGFIKWRSEQYKNDAMEEFSELFYISFRRTLSNLKYHPDIEKYQIKQLKYLLSLEQKNVRKLFQVNIINISTFKDAIRDVNIISQFQKGLLSIIKDYNAVLDENIAFQIIEETLKLFYKEVRINISEKQSLYLILEHTFETLERFHQFKLQLNEIHQDIKEVIKQNSDISIGLSETQKTLEKINDKITINHSSQEYIKQVHKLPIKFIEELIQNHNYVIAIEKLNELRDLFEENEIKDEIFGLTIFNKLGLCHERIEKTSDANNFYIKALNFKPNSPNIIRQAIIAYEREENLSEKDRLVKKLNKKFPNDKNTIIVNLEAIETEENLNIFIQQNANFINLNDIEILLTLYRTYNIIGNRIKAIESLEKAIPLAQKELSPFLQSMLAYNITHNYLEAFNLLEKINLSVDDTKKIQQGIDYYEKAWNTFKNTSQKKLQSRILINLAGLYALLNDIEHSIEIAKEALNIVHSDFYLQKLLSYYHLLNDQKSIISEVRNWDWEDIKNQHDVVTIYLIALSSSKEESNIKELIKIATDFISKNKDSFQFDTILSILIVNLIKFKEFQKIENLIHRLKLEFPQKEKLQLIESRFLRNKNELEKAKVALGKVN